MAQAAECYADKIILTNDNPRGEDPQQIIDEIKQGLSGRVKTSVVLDRAKAIRRAIDGAHENDMVLIAGKGHEMTQTIGDQTIPLSDVEEVAKLFTSQYASGQ